MTTFLESLARRKEESTTTDRSPWQRLVMDVAAEALTDEAAVLSKLAVCGKTVDDLIAAVAMLRRRREWAEQLAAGATAEPTIPEIDAALESLEERRQAAIAEFDAEGRRLLNRKREAVTAIQAAAGAKRELLATADPAAVSAATAGIDAEIAALEQERSTVIRAIGERVQQLSDATDPAVGDRLRKELRELTARRDAFHATFERLNAARTAATAIALLPGCF